MKEYQKLFEEDDSIGLAKSCPFCGDMPAWEDNGCGGWYIFCNGCSASTDVYETEKEVIDAWEMRVKIKGDFI